MNDDPLDLRGPNPWRTRSSRLMYDNGSLRLHEDAVEQPDGEPGRYVYVEIAWPIVAVVPIDDEGNVHLVRQWRYPWRRNSWEIPSGHGEPNEAPLEGARRELAEEVGLRADDWEPLWTGSSSATIDGHWFMYLARGLAPVEAGVHKRDGAEFDLVVATLPLAEAVGAALDGRIEHGMSALGLLAAARRLNV